MHEIDGPWHNTFSLLPDAPLRLAAMLAAGRYELRHVAADGTGYAGTFTCAGSSEARVLTVQLAPR